MFTLNLNHSRRNAFAHGFLKGLAAPLMLYHKESAPALPDFVQIQPPQYPIAEALAGDWMRVGLGLSVVIEKHGKANKPAT